VDRSQRLADTRPQHANEKRPLSSFIPREPAIAETPNEEQINFAPGTTVASFNWPAVCRTLKQQSSVHLDNVVRLLMARAGAGHSLIGVLGLFPRVGATTTALCLASRAASRGRRVILADGNFRSPRLASLLDAVPTAGWEEVMKHTAPLADAVVRSTDDNLDLLALGSRLVKDPHPMVGGLQAAVSAGVLRHAYELAILDVGTFFDPISQPILLELVSNLGVDAVVAVAGPGPADRRDVATIVEYLDRSGCELLGVIENRAAKQKAA
jgi:Mrp family chromosome partitioning ATPase